MISSKYRLYTTVSQKLQKNTLNAENTNNSTVELLKIAESRHLFMV